MKMRQMVTKPTYWMFRWAGYDISRRPQPGAISFPDDFEPDEIEDICPVLPYTMTSMERIVSLIRAVKYLSANNIEGDIVECGVWRGGSMMAAALTLKRCQDTSRNLWLYDTFEGMPPPGEDDVTWYGETADDVLVRDGQMLCAGLDQVKNALGSVGYDDSKIHYVKGKVEDTIPDTIPEKIALLRLDTDWYESTKHELIHLYPRLVPGGVIIFDDYGWWEGARKATDEYLNENNVPLLLNRIDTMGRIGIKV